MCPRIKNLTSTLQLSNAYTTKTPVAQVPKTKLIKSAYIHFMKDNYQIIKQSNPQLKGVGQIGKKAGEVWRTLSEEQKKPYQEKALRDKMLSEFEEKKKRNKNKL
eukprot:TRINITY_DN15854_c0_g1_i1.p1 TRINITY_DN15854_c0_g1~~TRINITY_DN15854_c0_g1_i1.p1  ORF type:complete len:105 (+),score=16.16 TRINITY_DN15854_c0_g1_i1:131-445(+)